MNNPFIILITGAARRLGAALALRLADVAPQKSKFILHYFSGGAGAAEVQTAVRARGHETVLWQQDLRAADLAESFRKLLRAHGPVDTLINNAAVFYPAKDKSGGLTPELWQEIMTVNAFAPLVLMQEFARALPDDRTGNIINILDQRVLNISHAFPAYTAGKSALWAMTQNMARALAPRIRVNAIAPGHVFPAAGEAEEKFRARIAKTPLGQGPAPSAIADAIWMILNSPSVTGACIPMDGGEHLVAKSRPADQRTSGPE